MRYMFSSYGAHKAFMAITQECEADFIGEDWNPSGRHWMVYDLRKERILYKGNDHFDFRHHVPLMEIHEMRGLEGNNEFTRNVIRAYLYAHEDRLIERIRAFSMGPREIEPEVVEEALAKLWKYSSPHWAYLWVNSVGELYIGSLNTMGREGSDEDSPKVHMLTTPEDMRGCDKWDTSDWFKFGTLITERVREARRWVDKKFHRAFWEPHPHRDKVEEY